MFKRNPEGFEARAEDALVKFYLRYGKKGKGMETMPPDKLAQMKS